MGNPIDLITDCCAIGLNIVVVSILPDQTHALQVAVLVVPQDTVFIPMQAVPGSGNQRAGGDGLGLAHAVGIVGV